MYEELVKSLRWLGFMFPETHPARDDADRISNNIHLDCTQAADAIEELSMKLHGDEAAIAGMKREIERMVVSGNMPRWIPATERLPEFEGAVLCMRKSNVYGVRPHQEILYVDEYGFKNYDDIYLADGVVTHWMPLPEPPKEE